MTRLATGQMQEETQELLDEYNELYNWEYNDMCDFIENYGETEFLTYYETYHRLCEDYDQKLVDEIASDWKTSSLTKEQIALCIFAEKLTLKPGEINEIDYKELQNNKFNDKAISEIVQVISYFNYINRVADGLGLEPEDFLDKKGYKKNLDQ